MGKTVLLFFVTFAFASDYGNPLCGWFDHSLLGNKQAWLKETKLPEACASKHSHSDLSSLSPWWTMVTFQDSYDFPRVFFHGGIYEIALGCHSVLMSCETTEGDMRIFVLAIYHRLQQWELGYLSTVHRVPHACAGRWCIQPMHLDLRLYSSYKVKVAMDRQRRQKKT